MKKILYFLLSVILLATVSSQLHAQNIENVAEPTEETISSTQPKTVKAVEIRGNKTIGLAAILAKIKTRVSQEYIQSVISDDLKRIYNMGSFLDVSVDREEYEGGFKVIFFVVEKSIVEEISFSKIRYYKPVALKRKIKTKEGKFLDNKVLNDDVRTIKEMYAKKGLSLASVRVEKDEDELTKKTNIHFIIKEGERLKIKKINIMGNVSYPDKKIMRIIKTRADSLITSGYLKEEVLEADMSRIKSFYEREGYIDAVANFDYDKTAGTRLTVNINIEEGKRYYVETISVLNNKIISDQEILDMMEEIEVGGVFSRERLTIDLTNIRALYFDRGYIFANVDEAASLNPDTGKVEIKLSVSEGGLAYINKVKIQGNDRTRDMVIRRELRLYPGDKFDGAKLRRSKQRLRNLGYFEDVNYDIEDIPSRPDHKDLVVQVKEAKTGSFSFGGGYSTVDQVVGFVEIEQKNFDFANWPTFTGGGQNLVLRAESGSTRNNMRLSFTEPWLFDYPISGGFDAYITEREREQDVGYAYDERRVGGELRLGKRFGEYIAGGVTYRREDIKIGNFAEGVSADLLAEEGKNTVSSFSFSLSRDTRDSVFNPTTGWLIKGTTDVAGGILGGDKDFVRVTTRTSYNIPFKFNSVLEFRLRAGVIDAYGDSEAVPIFERFFAGGSRTIRGYDERKVGPLAATNDPIGGESILVGNIEYTIPVIEYIKLAVFIDSGNVWSKVQDFASGDYKSGAGLGLRIKTPIGPVNLDYGYPLNDEPGEEERSGKFYFSVSRGF